MASITASARTGAASVTIVIPADVRADDVLVYTGLTSVSAPSLPSAVTAGAKALEQVHGGARTCVWFCKGPAPGSVTVTPSGGSINSSAAFLIRDAAALFDVADAVFVGTTSSAPDLTVPAVTVGTTQAVLSHSFPCDVLPAAGSLPSVAAWTPINANTTRTAHAVPSASPDTFRPIANRAIASPAKALVRVVVGAPAPNAPSDVAVTPGVESLAASWAPPIGGGPVTSYDVRLDTGAVLNVGTALEHTFAALTPSTDYLAQVRAAGPGGVSEWVTVFSRTLDVPPPTPSAEVVLALEVGFPAVNLLGDAYSLTIRRGNSTRGVTDALEAGTLTAVVKGPSANPLTVPQVRTGAPVVVKAGIDRGLGVEWEDLYTGTLDRARLVYDGGADKADPDAYRVTLTATDVVPALAGHPHETAVGGTLTQRVAHVLDPTGLPYTVEDPATPVGAPPALATSERTAAGNLRLAVDTDHGLSYVDRHGVIRVRSDQSRPRTPAAAAADLAATDDPNAPAASLHYYDLSPTLDTEALVNVLDVEAVTGAGTTTTTHVDTTSLEAWGPHAGKVTVNDGVPETHADLWLASRVDPALLPERLSLNVLERPSHLEAAATLEPYATVSVARAGVFPAPVTMAVRGVEHTITADRRTGVRWLCHLDLRPLEVLATRWDDVPPTLRWDDLPPTMTWDDAVRWHPYL